MKTVTWTVTKIVPIGCPDYKPDSYTGEYSSSLCAVYHCKTVTEKRTEEFNSVQEAEAFIKNAPVNCSDFKIL